MAAVLANPVTPFEQFVDGLLRLQELECAGRAETPAADEVRDEMDRPWYRLSPEEIERAKIVSSDLYMLSGGESLLHVPEAQRQPGWVMAGYERARDTGDYWRALQMLRHAAHFTDAGNLAFMRALGYERVNLPQVAVRFYELAWRESGDAFCRWSAIRLLLALDRWPEALQQATEILAQPEPEPLLLLAAGEVLLNGAHRALPGTPPDAAGEAVRAYQEAVRQLSSAQPARSEELELAHLGLALAYQFHGDRSAALDVWDELLARWPDNPLLYVSRGLLRYRTDRAGAAADFAVAVDRRVQAVWPYLYLAPIALERGDEEECISLCRLARAFTNDRRLVGRTYEWQAIAEAARGTSLQTVEALFDRAEECLGHEAVLAQNRSATIAARAQGGPPFRNLDGIPDPVQAALSQLSPVAA